ncbi:flagellar basal body-associated FliL family protein [Dermatobacter hominis]|uniref:flagellar basal body-associated FliL family protein n=1 Tax=Dermatobacter hominis TaxID=2884263 RepID=UPI001D116E4C|nr:flagellar basal body-associated FliL family protein [Dermatobacter hominis]UDY37191.1 flagellar basal body-associated FliL family protein [Dermatobacter hominis]
MTATTTRTPTADEGGETPSPSAPAPAKKGRFPVVVAAVVLAVGLVGAAFVLRGGGGAAEEVEPEPPKAGEVVPLDALTLNLADGHLARVGVAVELTESTTAADWEKAGGPSRMSDSVISRIGALRAEEVTAERVKDELHDAGADRFGDEFHGVYLTELVVQ